MHLLELHDCLTTNQDAFLSALKKLAPRLTHLKMLNHGSKIAYLHVLNACPRLTHFVYQTKVDFSDDMEVIDKEPMVYDPAPSIGVFPTITHLTLDVMLDTEKLLNAILRRCPNLRSFAGTSFVTADIDNSEIFPRFAVNYDLLFKWCPKLTFVNGSLSYVYLKDLVDHSKSLDNDGFTGLRYLSVADVYEQTGIVRHLTKSQGSIEFLSINPILAYENIFSWTDILIPLQFTSLRVFELRRIDFDARSIVTILNQCPALEEAYLNPKSLMLNSSVIQLLQPMFRLRKLICFNISFTDGLSLMTLLERLPSIQDLAMRHLTIPPIFPNGCAYPKQLKKLCLRDICWTHDDDGQKEAPTHLFQWFATNTKVEEVLLSGISEFTSRTLPSIASISTLKKLEVELEETQCGETEVANLRQFAASLDGTGIEDIYIETWWHLPDAVVGMLKELPRLKVLNAYHRWENSYCAQCSRTSEATF